MANRKLPPAAFEYYFSLGPDRSYVAVAKEFKVSKPTVVSMAKAEGWQQKIRERESKTAATIAKKADETVEQMNERHIKMLKAVQFKALEALKTLPIKTAHQAVTAIIAATVREKEIRDNKGTGVEDIEAIIKREYAEWMRPGGDEGWGDDRP